MFVQNRKYVNFFNQEQMQRTQYNVSWGLAMTVAAGVLKPFLNFENLDFIKIRKWSVIFQE